MCFKFLISDKLQKIVTTIVVTIFTLHLSMAQMTVTIYDKETNETLPQATIEVVSLQTNEKKFYGGDNFGVVNIPASFTAANPTFVLRLSYMGFKPISDTIQAKSKHTVFMEMDAYLLPTCVITAQYDSIHQDDAVQKVTIIDSKKIEDMSAVSLNDVLANEMNIRISQDNILGSSMTMQGVSGENVKILIDGVPVVGRLDGSIDLSQINLNDVEQIEIIEGPQSVSYGTNALAGTINIITKKDQKKPIELAMKTYYENVGKYNIDGKIGYKNKRHYVSVSGGRNYFDGWNDTDATFSNGEAIADNSRYKQWKPKEQYFGSVQYNYKLKQWNLRLKSDVFNEKITNKGTPRLPYHETAFDDYYRTYRFDNAVFANGNLKNGDKLNFIVAYNQYKRVKNTYFVDLTTLDQELTSNTGDQDTSKFNQWVLRGTYAMANDTVKLNYQFGYDINLETAYGERIENKKQQQGDYAVFASAKYLVQNKLTFQPALRYGYNTNYSAPLLPSLNALFSHKKMRFRGSVARGFRAPTLKEQYFEFNDSNHNIQGNQDLDAEHSTNYSLGVTVNHEKDSLPIKVDVAWFYNDISNMITLAQSTSNAAMYSYTNIGRYKTTGTKVDVSLKFNHFKTSFGASYIGRYNILSETENVDRFNYYPELRTNISYVVTKLNVTASLFCKYQGKSTAFALDGNNDVVNSYIDAYTLADLTFSRPFFNKQVKIIVGSKNLFDVKSVNSSSSGGTHSAGATAVPIGMGRTYFMTMKFNFGIKKATKIAK